MFPVFCVSSLYYMQCHLYRIHNICIYDCLYNHLGASLISSSLHHFIKAICEHVKMFFENMLQRNFEFKKRNQKMKLFKKI